MEAQYPHHERPSIEDLEWVVNKCPNELTKMSEWKQANKFSIDQVVAIFELWGIANQIKLQVSLI